jgi:hypothetical protein
MPPGYGYPMAPTNAGKAVAVLVLGICSLVFLTVCGLGVIAAIVALSLAPGARREIEQSGGRLTGLGLIKGGQVTSWITVGLTVLAVIGIAAVASTGGFDEPSTY